MNRHAFLIMAHNEFDILQILIKSLDHPNNDIYLHIDKKIEMIPIIKTTNSKLFILKDRVDVCWGDISVVEAEYKLYEASCANGAYLYYHLISGVDMPLLNMKNLHDFFQIHKGKEFIGFSTYDYSKEVDRKVNYIHLFPQDFRKTGLLLNNIKGIIRAVFLRIQLLLRIKRYQNVDFKKGTQWVSITNDFVHFLCLNKNKVFKIYQNSFCADEIFKQTICWNSQFRNRVFCIDDEANSCLRMIGWNNGVLTDWSNSDYEKLMKGDKIFARKFNSKNIEVVERIFKHISS